VGIFDTLFGKQPNALKTNFRIVNDYNPVFTLFGNNAYSSDIVRGCIHSIASNVGKLKPKYVYKTGDGTVPQTGALQKLLEFRPNIYMSTFDFLYKISTQLMLNNNAFAFADLDNSGNIKGIYPIDATSATMLQDDYGNLYLKFILFNGKQYCLPYEEIIHIRRHFNKHDFYGESPNEAILPTLNIIQTIKDGIVNSVKASAFFRGILKTTNSVLSPADKAKVRNDFVNDLKDVTNNAGVASLDAKADFQELKNNNISPINPLLMKEIREQVYRFYNVNESIVTNNYDENQWNAFYEGVIEPIAIQLSLEFTAKLFTPREQAFGNMVVFEANRLQYASATTKINLIKQLAPLGLFTINESREIFNLAPVDGGDKRVMTLNVVNADKADQYQGVGQADPKQDNLQDNGTEEDDNNEQGS